MTVGDVVRLEDLEAGRFYLGAGGLTPGPSSDAIEIVSVGRKWLRFRPWFRDYGTGPMRAHAIRKVLMAGWQGTRYREVEKPS